MSSPPSDSPSQASPAMQQPLRPAMPPPVQVVPIQRWPQGLAEQDTVAAEVPVALVFNGISHAVMMATPQNLEDFALGFALSEGILDSVQDCYGIEVYPRATIAAADTEPQSTEPQAGAGLRVAVEVQITVAARCFDRLKQQRRSLAGRTGCGLCGVESLQRMAQQLHSLPLGHTASSGHAVQASTVLAALQALPTLQPLNRLCGSLHAAGWAHWDGTLCHVAEDVGRHNALDKLLGWHARLGRAAPPGFVVMSSRASYELVYKCARMQVPLLATISAPTALAVQLAQQAGMQLWGLGRAPQVVRYAPPR